MDHILAAMLGGFLLDLLLGDPVWVPWPHPVVVMGRCVNGLEVMLRKIFPATHSGELAAYTKRIEDATSRKVQIDGDRTSVV